MKVISIKEPYATLIYDKKKKIETRSWKTNYRGELYIHASKSKINKKKLIDKDINNLIDENNFNYGKIICKCILKDCIYMDEEFINNIKNTEEYKLGYYEIGRYAWILDDIKQLDEKIEVNKKIRYMELLNRNRNNKYN